MSPAPSSFCETPCPGKSAAELLALLMSSGKRITYPSGGAMVTTPRIDLSAAYEAGGGT